MCCREILICITMLESPRAFCRCNCFTETMLQCLNEKPDSSGMKHVCVNNNLKLFDMNITIMHCFYAPTPSTDEINKY